MIEMHDFVIASISALLGGMCGGTVGIIVMAMCVAAAKGDAMLEAEHKQEP